MIRIEWFCRRCRKKIDEKEFKEFDMNPGVIFVPSIDNSEVKCIKIQNPVDICEDCLVEYEALKCRQAEELRMFWEECTEEEEDECTN